MRCPTPAKRRYHTKVDALLKMSRMHVSPREHHRFGYECRAYECPCGRWHLTSQSELR